MPCPANALSSRAGRPASRSKAETLTVNVLTQIVDSQFRRVLKQDTHLQHSHPMDTPQILESLHHEGYPKSTPETLRKIRRQLDRCHDVTEEQREKNVRCLLTEQMDQESLRGGA
jgi:hypothetical protein